LVWPFCADYGQHSFNLDGLVTARPTANEPTVNAYLQLFRSGIVESTTTKLVRERDRYGLSMASFALARDLAAFLDRTRALMKRLDVNPPASLFVSALNVRGVSLAVGDQVMFSIGNPTPFDRDHLLMREVTLLDWEGSAFDLPSLERTVAGRWAAALLRLQRRRGMEATAQLGRERA
jgi:hypothetical protein